MSFQAIKHVIDNSKEGNGNYFSVLLIIAYHADAEGQNAWPSLSTIAREARTSKSTVVRAVQSLENSGDLIVRRSDGYRGTNVYEIPMDRDQAPTAALFDEPIPSVQKPKKTDGPSLFH